MILNIHGYGAPCGYFHPCPLRRVPNILGNPIANSARAIILLVFLPLARVGDRFGDVLCLDCAHERGQDEFTKPLTQLSNPITSHLSPPGDDLQRLSTLEGDARIGSLNFTAFAEDGPGKLCILQQFGFRYVADFFPHELLSYIAKFASKDAVRVP